MSTKFILTAIAAALTAASTSLTVSASKAPEDGAAASAAAPAKPGRPPKDKVKPADIGGGDDLGLGGDDGLGLGGGDDLGLGGDDGLGLEPEAPKGPTEAEVRTALGQLRSKDNNDTKRVVKLMALAIADATKQPTVPNIPVEKYQYVVDSVAKLLKK